jgi:Flp pilus assembly protein TadG
VVELALCLPLILMMTFGAIEAANSIYLKQTLKTAAYEAARAATGPGGTQSDGESKFEEVLASRNVKNAQITFSPTIASISQQGTPVTITVTAPSNSNSVGPQWYTKGAIVRAQVIMPKL